MLTSARERLEVLKMKRAMRQSECGSSGPAASASAALRGSSISQSERAAATAFKKTGAPGCSLTVAREIVPHTQLVLPPGEKQEDYWKNVTVERDRHLEERERREREANRKFREEQKRILDAHVALASARREKKPEVDAAERAAADQVYQDYLSENRRRKEQRLEEMAHVARMRDEQIALKKKRVEAERRDMKQFELRAVRRAEEALQQEKSLVAMSREEARIRRREVAMENERLRQMRLARKADLDAEDSKALARFSDVLEQQAAVSRAEFETMNDKMRMRESIAFERSQTIAEKAKIDEEKATALTRQREEAEARRQIEAEKLAKQRARQIKLDVKRQAEERKQDAKSIDAIKALERQAAKEESESIQRAREQERLERIAKQKQVEEALQRQIAEQKAKQTIVMSAVERRLNSGYLPQEVEVPDVKVRLPLIR